MGKILGIDLGTTNTVIAVWDGREPRVVVSEQGSRLTPSVVGFGDNGDIFVGEIARRQAVANAKCTIFSAKRFIGQQFDAVEADRDAVPYEVVEGDQGEARILVGDREFSPQEISAHVLAELKKSAEAFLGEPIDGAVVTVPAYFNDAQRTATKEAGQLAGLDVRRIINEPTAAALAYGLDKIHQKVIAVYDFGGGTFDVSILSVGDDVIEVIATHGDTHLGGDDIDARIVQWMIERFEEQTGVRLNGNPAAHQRLRESAEQAKVALSSRTATEINLPFLGAGDEGPVHLEVALSRDMLEEMISDLVDRTLSSCVQALSDAGKKPADIDDVVLVGGSSRIPLVQKRVTAYFRKEPRRTVNPDEVVALGAAVQAGVISGEVKGIVLLDVTSLSLGVETHDGQTAVVIPRNTTIPTEAMRTFTTATDGQASVEVHVVQGEVERARANDSLGRFDLDGLRPAPAGTPQIDVTFAIDLNGMVQVSARDRSTGRSQTVSVSARTGVTQDPRLGGKSREAASQFDLETTQALQTAQSHKAWPQRGAKSDAGSQPAAQQAAPRPAAQSSPHQSRPDSTPKAERLSSNAERPSSNPEPPSSAQAGAKMPTAAEMTLDEAERLLGQHGDKIPGEEKSSLQQTAQQLRALMGGKAAPEDVERSRSALRQVASRIKESLLLRRGR